MTVQENKKGTLVLVGGTGQLGSEMADGLLQAQGFSAFVALVRASSSPEKIQLLKDRGWFVRTVDFNDSQAIQQALAGAHTVIATVRGDDMVAMQNTLVDAAKAAGVSLFVPSQFGIDPRRWEPGHPILDADINVLEHAKAVGMPTLVVSNGLFTDMIFGMFIDADSNKTTFIDGGKAKVSFTRRRDIGYVLAKALSDPQYANGGYLCLQAETMAWKDAVAVYEQVTGRMVTYEDITTKAAKQEETALLQQFFENGDLAALGRSFGFHILRVPAAGFQGLDVSAESQTYDIRMEPIAETIQDVYMSK